ncbi:MAG: cyclic nucleotide-binding domain-containing protein [Polyangiaceae bacterium]|nr:cyclic nucleotide-binding domain-containing protein [Polyangiaceae bacterium]
MDSLMVTPPERLAALRRVPAFSGLDDSALAGLGVCLRWREFGAGQALYRQGEPGDSLAIVASGALLVTVALQHGGQYDLAYVTAGGIVGEMVCFDPAPRSATVKAVEPTVIAELSRDGLTGLRGGAPKVYAAVMKAVLQVVGSRLRQMNHRIDHEQNGRTDEPDIDRPTLDAISMDRPGMDRPTQDRLSVSRLTVDRSSLDRPSVAQPVASKKRDGFRGLVDKLLGTR